MSFNLNLVSGLNAALAASGTGGAAPASGAALPGGVTLLTPQALLAYCSESLGSINSQMETLFDQQQTSDGLINSVQGLANAVNAYAKNGVPSNADLQALDQQFTAAINAAGGPSTQLGQELVAAAQDLDPNVGPANLFGPTYELTTNTSSATSQQVTTCAQSLGDVANDINSDAQLGMIKLQSLMSDQQTAVQMCTNLVQQLGQINQDIVSNLKAG